MSGSKIFWPCVCRAARATFFSNLSSRVNPLVARSPLANYSTSFRGAAVASLNRFVFEDSRSYATVSSSAESSEKVEPPPAVNEAPESKEVETLKAEVEKLTEKANDYQDKYKRALAECENIRNRMMRQIEDAKLFGIQGFCKDLLEVADILGRATESVPADVLAAGSPHLKNLHEGLTMTEAQLQKVFTRHGLVKINPVGEKFNPNEHEALFEQVVEGREPGTVAVVTKIGYKLHQRTLRPALVGVAKAP